MQYYKNKTNLRIKIHNVIKGEKCIACFVTWLINVFKVCKIAPIFFIPRYTCIKSRKVVFKGKFLLLLLIDLKLFF